MMLIYLNEFLISVIIKCPKFALHLWRLLSGLADLGWLGRLVQTVQSAPGLRAIICCLLPSPPSPWLEADCSANFPCPTKHICLHAAASIISDHLLNISTVQAAAWGRLWTQALCGTQKNDKMPQKTQEWEGKKENSFSHPIFFCASQ